MRIFFVILCEFDILLHRWLHFQYPSNYGATELNHSDNRLPVFEYLSKLVGISSTNIHCNKNSLSMSTVIDPLRSTTRENDVVRSNLTNSPKLSHGKNTTEFIKWSKFDSLKLQAAITLLNDIVVAMSSRILSAKDKWMS